MGRRETRGCESVGRVAHGRVMPDRVMPDRAAPGGSCPIASHAMPNPHGVTTPRRPGADARTRDRRTARPRTCVNPERASGVPFVSL